MVRVGFARRSHQTYDQLSNREDAKTNLAGGLAFDIADPSARLLSMLGANFFDEPTYYVEEDEFDGTEELTRSEGEPNEHAPLPHRFEQLSVRARSILTTAEQVASGAHPLDLLSIAHWARREMHIRTTPCVLLAVAASHPETKRFVRAYCPKIIARADELRQVFGAYMHFYGRPVPNSLKRGLADAFSQFDDYSLMRYDTRDHPTFADVLLMIDRGSNRAVSRPVFEYLVNRQVIDPDATPLLAARTALAKRPEFDDEARHLARIGRPPWETLLSQFGNTADVWEFLVREHLVGYMALLRNLRNLIQAGVPDEVIHHVATRVVDGVAESQQLPFRFLSAYRAVSGHRYADPYGFECVSWSPRHDTAVRCSDSAFRQLLDALETAMLKACEHLPQIPGTTLLAADNSGSMGQPVSTRSFITVADAANMLCAMTSRVCEHARVLTFATEAVEVHLEDNKGIIANMDRVARTDTGGCATNAYRVFERLRQARISVDRVILLSDMQCWNTQCWNSDRELAPEFLKYRRAINPEVWLHSIDLVGYGDSAVPADTPRVNLVSGFSEKVLNLIAMTEGWPGLEDEALPSIEYVRQHY